MTSDTRLSLRVDEGLRSFLIADAQERGMTISECLRAMIKRRQFEKMRGE